MLARGLFSDLCSITLTKTPCRLPYLKCVRHAIKYEIDTQLSDAYNAETLCFFASIATV
jgi:hypothetical protein